MPSQALDRWRAERTAALNDLFGAIRVIRHAGVAHRRAIQHLSRGFVATLSAEFQGCCKDLHRECAEHFVSLVPAAIQDVVRYPPDEPPPRDPDALPQPEHE